MYLKIRAKNNGQTPVFDLRQFLHDNGKTCAVDPRVNLEEKDLKPIKDLS